MADIVDREKNQFHEKKITRVFNVDRNCCVIFASSFFKKKDKFLRIGNSPFLKRFTEYPDFVSLYSPLMTGDLSEEGFYLDNVSHSKMIGLKRHISPLMKILKSKKLKSKEIELVYADGLNGEWTENKSEDTLINELNNDFDDIEKNLKNHSFAAFYRGGNIRVFNKDGIYFDLNTFLKERPDYKKITSLFYSEYYKKAYSSDGFIMSGNSMFFYSSNQFCCFTSSVFWVSDAGKVGINIDDIVFLYKTKDLEFTDDIYEIISKRSLSKNILKIVSSEKSFINGFSSEIVNCISSANYTFNQDIGNYSIQIQNKRVVIKHKTYKFYIKQIDSFFKNYYFDVISFQNNQSKTLHIDRLSPDGITIYSYNPFTVSNGKLPTNSMELFFKPFGDKISEDIEKNLKSKDLFYSYDDMFQIENKSVYHLLFNEQIRRIIIESKAAMKSQLANCSLVTGEMIVRSGLLVEQVFYIDTFDVRNSYLNDIAIVPDDYVNPINFISNSTDSNSFEKRYEKFKEQYSSNGDNKIYQLSERIYQTINDRCKYYLNERKKLLDFIKKVKETDRDYKILKESKSQDIKDVKLHKSNKKSVLKILLPLFWLLLLFLSSGVGYGIYKGWNYLKNNDFFIQDKKNEDAYTQLSELKSDFDKHNDVDNLKKSQVFSFYMTLKDQVDLTNKIAIKNNYHRMLFPIEKFITGARNPDWIYPGNVLIMPDEQRVVVQSGDTMWDICENYLIKEINKDEIEIAQTIMLFNQGQLSLAEAKEYFKGVIETSSSEMIRGFLRILIMQDDYRVWQHVEELENREADIPSFE